MQFMALNQSKETKMIVKKDKAGNEIASWDTVELAAKAAGVSPKVLKGHMYKKKPPKLGGFVFVENKETAIISKPIIDELLVKNNNDFNRLHSGNFIHMEPTPESFNGEKLDKFTAEEAGLYNISPRVMLDEYGEPITTELPYEYVNLENAEVLGHTGIPPEAMEPIATEPGDPRAIIEETAVNPYWLLSPIEQRLKRMRESKNS